MKTLHKRFLYFYCINVSLFVMGLFLYGFFPLSYTSQTPEYIDMPFSVIDVWLDVDKLYKPKVDKMIIMVIDAIRYDFVNGEDTNVTMPYVYSMLNKCQFSLFKMKAHSPTVTMPRLKAITSGSVPNFADVVMNFGSSEFLSDNIIDQAKKKYKIVFYGDDTWLKLFPTQFTRYKGVASFFVTDYIQVDDNVTLNMAKELLLDDWDIMILHYLGLDHIGHLEGPRSELIRPKLNEMDNVIKTLHRYLLLEEKRTGKSTMLMVLGDHGMADFGGHGGTSYPEVIIPMLTTVPISCEDHSNENLQINIAPTIAVFLGLPIPSVNYGHIIPELLLSTNHKAPDNVTMYALYYNAYQVVGLYLKRGGSVSSEGFMKYWEAQGLHASCLKKKYCSEKEVSKVINSYLSAIKLLSSNLYESSSDYHLLEMVISVVTLFQLLLIALFIVDFEVQCVKSICIATILWAFGITVSFWALDIFNIYTSTILPAIIRISLAIVLTLNFLLIANFRFSNIYNSINFFKTDNEYCRLLLAGTILQFFSTFGTSLIEQEKQVWYHIFIFLLIYAFIKSFGCSNCVHGTTSNNCSPSVSPRSLVNSLYMISCKHRHTLSLIELAVIHRVLNSFHVNFIALLNNQDNKLFSSLLAAAGLINIFWWACIEIPVMISKTSKFNGNRLINILEYLLTAGCLLLIYYYRTVTGSVLMPISVTLDSRGVKEVRWFFGLLLGLLILKLVNIFIHIRKIYSTSVNNCLTSSNVLVYLTGSLVTIWLLVTSLLLRPYMIWMTPMLILTFKTCSKLLDKNIIYLTVLHYWIGMLFYFYQGNSNMITSIDITPGYVGQSQYDAFTAASFISIHTFCYPVLSYLMLLMMVFQGDWSSQIIALHKTRCVLFLGHLVLYLVVITVCRHHLFIWSVFSPKLLYVAAHGIILVILLWFTEIIVALNGLFMIKVDKLNDGIPCS